jgi:hypothetical protein
MFIVVPMTDNGDHRTVGLMSTASHNQGMIVAAMTSDEARDIAADLIKYANR